MAIFDDRMVDFRRLNPEFRQEESVHQNIEMKKKIGLGALALGALAVLFRRRNVTNVF